MMPSKIVGIGLQFNDGKITVRSQRLRITPSKRDERRAERKRFPCRGPFHSCSSLHGLITGLFHCIGCGRQWAFEHRIVVAISTLVRQRRRCHLFLSIVFRDHRNLIQLRRMNWHVRYNLHGQFLAREKSHIHSTEEGNR